MQLSGGRKRLHMQILKRETKTSEGNAQRGRRYRGRRQHPKHLSHRRAAGGTASPSSTDQRPATPDGQFLWLIVSNLFLTKRITRGSAPLHWVQ